MSVLGVIGALKYGIQPVSLPNFSLNRLSNAGQVFFFLSNKFGRYELLDTFIKSLFKLKPEYVNRLTFTIQYKRASEVLHVCSKRFHVCLPKQICLSWSFLGKSWLCIYYALYNTTMIRRTRYDTHLVY